MFSILDYHFWIAFLFFILAIFFSLYVPGIVLMKHIDKQMSIKNIILALCIGYILWTLQGYIFGYLHIRWMSYLYVVIMFVIYVWQKKYIIQSIQYFFDRIKKNKIVVSVICFGVVLQTIYMFPSGFVSIEGMRFWGINSTDGLMHMAYIQKMVSTFPPNEPGAYLLPIRNYHFLMNLSVAELARVWNIPAHHIFFQFLPPLFSVITACATYLLMRAWTGSKIAGLWALFFLFLAGDTAYIFMLILQQQFGFHTPAIDNGITQFSNMPHAAAKMLFMGSLLAFYYWIKTQQKKWGLLTVLLMAPLIGFKVYFGIFAAIGLSFVIAGKIITRFILESKIQISFKTVKNTFSKESFSLILLLLFAVISSFIFLPHNSETGGLQYYPMEWPKLFLSSQNLDIKEWWLRMQVYEEAGNIRNIIIYNLFAAFVALICIHGTRILGIVPHKKLAKKLGWEHMLFMVPGIILFQLLGLLTLQKAGGFNVFNFFVVSTVIMALFTAYLVYELSIKKKVWAYFLVTLIVILTIPRAVNEFSSIFTTSIVNAKTSGLLVPSHELEALNYLRNNTSQMVIVQSHPANQLDSTTTYVAYFSGRDSYLSGFSMIDSHGQPAKPLQENVRDLFALRNQAAFNKKAKEMNISYLYLNKNQQEQLLFKTESKYFTKVFENKNVIILEIKQ